MLALSTMYGVQWLLCRAINAALVAVLIALLARVAYDASLVAARAFGW